MIKILNASIIVLFFFAPQAFSAKLIPSDPSVEAAAAQALMEAVKELRASAKDIGDGRTTLANNSYELDMIATSLAKLGHLEQALKITDLMLINGYFSSTESAQTRDKILQLSGYRAAVLDELRQSMILTSKIKDQKTRDSAWLDLISVQVKDDANREILQVPNIISSIKAPEIKAEASLLLAKAYIAQDNNKAAQKVLFKITPLVPQDFNTLIRTAYLFSRSERAAVAKQLFERAKTMLPPLPGKSQIRKETFDPFRYPQQRRYSWYLLKSGFVNKWIKLCNENPNIFQRNLGAMKLTFLLKHNQIDIATKAVKNSIYIFPGEEAAGLEMIAEYIYSKNPEKSRSLREEAVKVGVSSIQKSHHDQSSEGHEGNIYRNVCTHIAYMFHELENEKQAQNWLGKAMEGATKEQVAYYRFYYAFIPFIRSYGGLKKSTFPSSQLQQLNDEIQSYLPMQTESDMQYRRYTNFLHRLIDAQIKAGQISDARNNITILENEVKQRMIAGKYVDNLIRADVGAIPRLWKKANDQKRCDQFLEYLFNVPQSLWPTPKVERASSFIQSGFIEKGLQLFHSLPASQQKEIYWTVWGAAFARAEPTHFPHEVMLEMPLGKKIRFLHDYVRALTRSSFRVPQ